jgi:hypothetical protein
MRAKVPSRAAGVPRCTEGVLRNAARVRFVPRPSDLDPFDARRVARWAAGSESAPAQVLSRTQRLSLGALLAEVWEMEHPSVSFRDDPAGAWVIEHLPDFEPAPTYEWGRARHPESGVLFEWTRADPHAERQSTRPIDPYEPMARLEIDETGDVVRLEHRFIRIAALACVFRGDACPLAPPK